MCAGHMGCRKALGLGVRQVRAADFNAYGGQAGNGNEGQGRPGLLRGVVARAANWRKHAKNIPFPASCGLPVGNACLVLARFLTFQEKLKIQICNIKMSQYFQGWLTIP